MDAGLAITITEAFSDVEFPGENNIVPPSGSDEALSVKKAFAKKTDWRKLDPEFLDTAPDGLGSALNFFSCEAFRFYLPAYLLADIAGKLQFVEPDFSLCFAFSDSWTDGIDAFLERNALFNEKQRNAIVGYLRFAQSRCDDPMIEKALREYWEHANAENGNRTPES